MPDRLALFLAKGMGLANGFPWGTVVTLGQGHIRHETTRLETGLLRFYHGGTRVQAEVSAREGR